MDVSLSINNMKIFARSRVMSYSAVLLVLVCPLVSSCQKKNETRKKKHPTMPIATDDRLVPKSPTHPEVEHLEKYPGELSIEIEPTLDVESGVLRIRFFGQGKCGLKIYVPYSDEGKRTLGFYADEDDYNVLRIALSYEDSRPHEWVMMLPDDESKFDKTLSYNVPRQFIKKYKNFDVECMVKPTLDGRDYDSIYFTGKPVSKK